jgi:hypothetical protein
MTVKGYLLVMLERILGQRRTADPREELAVSLRWLAGEANRRPSPGLRLRGHRAAVERAEGDLRMLASRLQAPRPVAPEGVARTRALLTDGTGPLYNPHRAAGLRAAIRDAARALDRDG